MNQKHYTIQIPENMPEYRKAFLRMAILDTSFHKTRLQMTRIEEDRLKSDLQTLFADIHFFLIAVRNIREGLKDLKFVLKTDQILNAIYKEFNSKLEHLDSFRDHLEHIHEGRLDGLGKSKQPLKDPTVLGNLYGDVYRFGGEEFNLVDAYTLIESLQDKLKSWSSDKKIYPLW